MDKKALQFLSRFSLPPNSLGYCGKNSAPEKFKKCITDGKCAGVQDELKKFIVLHPYLRTLSKITGLSKFSYKVAEAYWLGNKEIKKAKAKHYDLLLKYFADQGVPEWLVEELEKRRPQKFIPTHLFHVLHVGTGKASGSVPFNIQTVNNCMIRWGRVLEISERHVLLNLNSLKREGRTYKAVKKKQKLPMQKGLLRGLRKGTILAVHWNQPIKVLTQTEAARLDYWTKEVLKSL